MNKYLIWNCTHRDNEYLIEVLNDCDLLSIQKELTEKGYVILATDYMFGKVFMKVRGNKHENRN